MAKAQWHSKESWRRASPNRERERAQNWRLDPDVSLGLIGEAGLQQIDAAAWIMGEMPASVTGFGSTLPVEGRANGAGHGAGGLRIPRWTESCPGRNAGQQF